MYGDKNIILIKITSNDFYNFYESKIYDKYFLIYIYDHSYYSSLTLSNQAYFI